MALPLPPGTLKTPNAGYWLQLWNYLVKLVAAIANQNPPTYRAVITSIAAYTGTTTGTLTGSVTGAIGAQDGITLAAGDRVFLPLVTGGAGGATAAVDSGPYLVVTPGGTGVAFILTRPPEYLQGSVIPESYTIKLGTEGTNWKGSEWRAFPTSAALVVGTGDPHFWPKLQAYAYTIGTGFVPVGLGTAFYLRTASMAAGYGFTSTNTTSAHAFWASTTTAGQGTGALAFTGTASDVIVGQAVNF
jgi:hypothetical protein